MIRQRGIFHTRAAKLLCENFGRKLTITCVGVAVHFNPDQVFSGIIH